MASSCSWYYLCVAFLLSAPSFLSCLLVTGEQVAVVEVSLQEQRAVTSAVLQGEVVEASWDSIPNKHNEEEPDLEGDLVLVSE